MANRKITLKNQLQSISWRAKDTYFGSLVVFVIASFLAYLQPFGMDKVERLYGWGFWLTICFCGYIIYAPFINLGKRILPQRYPLLAHKPWTLLVLLTLAASVIMSLLAPFIVLTFFDLPMGYVGILGQSAVMSLFIGGLITFIHTVKSLLRTQHQMIHEQQQQLSQEKAKNADYRHQGVEQLLSNMPLEKRGQLLCLEIDDHYLNIHTDKGNHLVLMRFKDALVLVKDYPGIQTHRSWWVAESAITGSMKEGRKLMLKLSNNLTVPVSKNYLDAVKDIIG